MTQPLQPLFDSNRRWAAETEARSPGFFTRLMQQQRPQYLWIGCADSRVPANQIVGLLPGELFVHRNVANVVVHSDLNCLSVVEFATGVLGVEHVMVVGHYGCSGVKAAMTNTRMGLADNWLRHVQDVHEKHLDWLSCIGDGTIRHQALCELNVLEQVLNLGRTTVIQDAWARGQQLMLHGWVYGLHNGLVNDLQMSVADPETMAQTHRAAVEALKRRYAEAVVPEAA
ncbi:carbonate dehydratase [Caldimonas tepidiphila]|uniref:carbonate dehydratase n=1 Tax=Caldimonas tepidiphila TaxID=2315841 RepID=UPI000E5C568F|nr:carbonate dehydratase [Caldimonas tepidiphila]